MSKVGRTVIYEGPYLFNRAPTVHDDGSFSFVTFGTRWIDTTNKREYLCLDPSVGAAVWLETTQQVLFATGKTRAPTYSDDITQNYKVGDHWIYGVTANALVYMCISNTPGAAIWVNLRSGGGGGGGTTVHQVFFGPSNDVVTYGPSGDPVEMTI